MAVITPKLLRRGLEIFAVISLVGFGGLLFYGNNLETFGSAMLDLKWQWVGVGVALASMDWFGGGMRIWVLLRHLNRKPPFWGSILAGGLGAWASYLTPSQTGGGPVMIFTLRRFGVPLPEAMISILITFVATIVFFAITGPLALILGAGQSLEARGILGSDVTLYHLFMVSLGTFVGIGFVLILLFSFPKTVTRLTTPIGDWLERRGKSGLAAWVRNSRGALDRAHECLVTFFRGRGWFALGAAVVLSAFAFANRLLAGYVVLRMLDIRADFVDVLLLQTLITFLLYFAPTPGGAGAAEILSLAVMSVYVPRELIPSYVLLWRIVVSYLTVGFGSIVFWRWLKGAEGKLEEFVESTGED